MTITESLSELVQACFTAIWLRSQEHDEAILEIGRLCRERQWMMATWDIDRGLRLSAAAGGAPEDEVPSDPLAALRSAGILSDSQSPTIVVLTNFHRFCGSAEIVQTLAHQITLGKQSRTVYVVLSPVVQIPIELEKMFTLVEHPLPSREQLQDIASGIATEEGELPPESELEAVLEAASGLTSLEAENAFSLSLVRHQRITPQAIWELKTAALKKSGLLQLYRGDETFESLGGLGNLKAFCKRSLLQRNSGNPLKLPRGVLLLGVPGTGKSAFAKALGNETGRPTLVLDIGGMLGSLVGETESNIRQALKVADAMSPCVLFIDEIEKALSGVSGGGQNDSGVSSRLFGTLLTWMSDRRSDVYVIATANDVSRMPPELTRAERFDGVVFLDLPGREQKDRIWDQYIAVFGLDANQKRPDDDQFTGAEIRSCCRLASLLDLPLVQAALNVVPVAVTASESVDRLRGWASGRCLNSETPGLYHYTHKTDSPRRRSVARSKPSTN